MGAGRTNNTGYGIRCDNTLTNAERLGYIRIAIVEARGFGILGILVAGTHAGFKHVWITHRHGGATQVANHPAKHQFVEWKEHVPIGKA